MNKNGGDKILTPDWCADDMVRHFNPTGRILEPCKGNGVFLKYLPKNTRWCEIDEGIDFFDWHEPVDWIITNPPFSLVRKFRAHAQEVSRNVVFLLPAWKAFTAYGSASSAAKSARMCEIRWYGTGSKLGFPMGNGIAAIHWSRGYSGPIAETFYDLHEYARQGGQQ
jgi:hypothetical protein